MNLSAVEQIARAVLYEGYMLYPYRPSSVKNKQRWNFGVLYPPAYSKAQNCTDPSMSQTECLIAGAVIPALEVRVRFLLMVQRTVRKCEGVPEVMLNASPVFKPTERLEVNGQVYHPWQEAVEREIVLHLVYGDSLGLAPCSREYSFGPGREFEELRNSDGRIAGAVVREHQHLRIGVEVSTRPHGDNVFCVSVRVHNRTPFIMVEQTKRDEALACSLLSAHVVLGAKNGYFVSLLDPPTELREVASQCNNIGTWPVLVGNVGECDTLLSSPIILYDYPQIAPESAGDLFDGTEIDEILSLRVMTLTDDEKREMRESDARARQILERTDSLPPEQLMKLHGVVKSVQPLKAKGEAR